mgnify:FL=1
MRQDIDQHKPLYMKGKEVISWDSHWGHWWITNLRLAGENSGNAWLQQDDRDSCPGSEKVIVRRSGTDDVMDDVSIIPSSQCKV